MKAIRIHRFGGPEALSVDELERPQPGAGEALIRVPAASVDPVDYKTRSGQQCPGARTHGAARCGSAGRDRETRG